MLRHSRAEHGSGEVWRVRGAEAMVCDLESWPVNRSISGESSFSMEQPTPTFRVGCLQA